jgi:hypothetical protein
LKIGETIDRLHRAWLSMAAGDFENQARWLNPY